MLFGKLKKADSQVNIILITGSCCIPGMAPLEEEARKMIERAISKTGVKATVNYIPVSRAMYGGIPKEVTTKLMAEFNSTGTVRLPAILINGRLVTYGVLEYDKVKQELISLNELKV